MTHHVSMTVYRMTYEEREKSARAKEWFSHVAFRSDRISSKPDHDALECKKKKKNGSKMTPRAREGRRAHLFCEALERMDVKSLPFDRQGRSIEILSPRMRTTRCLIFLFHCTSVKVKQLT